MKEIREFLILGGQLSGRFSNHSRARDSKPDEWFRPAGATVSASSAESPASLYDFGTSVKTQRGQGRFALDVCIMREALQDD